MKLVELAEKQWLPDPIIRVGIRQRLRTVLEEESKWQPNGPEAFVEELKASPIAIQTREANEQHYEVPTAYFTQALGPCMKYSSGFWPEGVDTLEGSEIASLELLAKRAQLKDGMRIMELGCGWGAFSLWAAEKFPNSQIVGVSNSHSQREYINTIAKVRGLKNITIMTADMNTFEATARYDRIVSIEMLEHMRNYQELFARISNWLSPHGKLFVHIFAHHTLAYPYRDDEEDNWMARHFFSGGIMPSENLFSHFEEDLKIDQQWRLNGEHYSQTLEAWLKRHDENKASIMKLFEKTYGPINAEKWFQRWRLFYMACSELFGYNGGNEWFVAHYLFSHSNVCNRSNENKTEKQTATAFAK